ncbi:MAG TPA: aldo/keto reductase [Rhizomicrobium sp.]|jgi:aryl-alcohol dehydrogenase-like predicted oxidoreductase|nr:aldo/keto reductase [Rhizomicrobium sp.]
METRKLGKSGIAVSVIGLGCNNFGAMKIDASRRVVDAALDAGITLFDTADVYGNRGGSEEQLGEILGARRKDIVLATKFAMPMDDSGAKSGASAAYIREACEASLKRLKTDWIDLYQQHRPDPNTPIEETLDALDDLVKQGKVRAIGCSNLPADQLAAAQAASRAKNLAAFVTAQDQYSLLVRAVETDLVPELEKDGMGLLPYFPLASGLLSGKYEKGKDIPAGTRYARMGRFGETYMTEENWAIVEKLTAFATARSHTLLELAFAWLLARPYLSSVIAGATRPEQVAQNAHAASWKLTPAEVSEVDRITAKGAG